MPILTGRKECALHSFLPEEGRQAQSKFSVGVLYFLGRKEGGGTLFPAYYIQPTKSAGVHSLLPTKSAGVTLSCP